MTSWRGTEEEDEVFHGKQATMRKGKGKLKEKGREDKRRTCVSEGCTKL